MDFMYVFLFAILFFIGTFFLLKKKYQNYFHLIFLIRTNIGIKFIEKISNFNGWKFIADFGIVSCLGGIGALYLSAQKRNIYLKYIFLIFGLFVAILYLPTENFEILPLILLISFILFGYVLIEKFSNHNLRHYLNFFLFAISTFLIAKKGFLIAIPLFYLQPLQDEITAIIISIFGIPALILTLLFIHAIEILFFNSQIPGVSPMIPKIDDQGLSLGFLGYDQISIPIIYGIIALAVVIISHELAHGILARKHDIEIKSTGLLTFGIIPIGAFVEPNEEKFKKKESFKKTHVYVMGSFANFVVCSVSMILIFLISPYSYTQSDGIIIKEVVNNSPADKILEKGMIIYAIDGNKVTGKIPDLEINKTIVIETNKGNKTLTTAQNPQNLSKGYIGIYYAPNVEKNFLYYILEILKWIMFLNLIVGITNLMPINPFDGGKIVEELINVLNLNKDIVDKIIFAILYIGLFLILINTLPLINIIKI